MTPSSSDHGRPVVAEMEEALPSIAVDTGQSVKVLPANGQGHDDGRLAVLEDLRDGATPIDLEFSLQRLLQPQLSGIEMPAPGVTAIAPQPSLHIRTQPRHQSQHSKTVKTNHTFTGIHRIGILYGTLVPAVRRAGRRAGYLGRAGVSVILRAGRSTVVGVRKGGIASGTAAQAAAKSVASGAAAAVRLSSKGAAAAGRAVFGATVVAVAQPARLARLLRRIHMAAPLRAVLKPIRRATANTVVVIANQGDVVVPAATTTVAKRMATEAPSATIRVSEPPVIRARSLTTHVKAEGAPGTASREGRLRPGAPYELATATAVPALLISDVDGTGHESMKTATEAVAVQPTAKRRRKASIAGAAVATPRRHLPAVAAAALHVPARAIYTVATGVALVMKYAATATLCAFFPRTCRILGIAAILSGPSLPLPPPFLLPPLPGLTQPRGWLQQPPPNPLFRGPLRKALAPLALLRGPFAVFATLRLVMPVVAPAVWRSLMYWQRTVPIVARYLLTSRRASALRSRGNFEAAEELWQRQHEWGAGALFDMLAEVKGFYLKLGQILASKTDMLPQPYTESLSRLLDRLPPAPYRVVRRTIAADLGVPPEVLFGELDPFPLASATIAQVHRGQLPDGRPVVVKVQHGPAHRMMRSDLANLSALSGLMEAAGLQLGFDYGSLVREYNEQVPLEFDFGREARVASAIRASLETAAESYPALRRVVVPRMVPSHSGGRVLTMEYLDGVPILDIAGMDLAVRHGLMTSLILAYGIMILRDGLFHSDPHPGNVLAMRRRRTAATTAAVAGGFGTGGVRTTSLDAGGRSAAVADGNWLHPSYYSALYSPAPTSPSLVDMEDLQVALLDFGQAKQLSAASRARYAMLVAAMAVRDDDLVLAVAGELGLVVDNCSDAFAAVAAYILFDTRMDFPEAHMGPMDPEAHEFRSAKVPSLPQDLFMIMRTITLLRGLLSSLQVDVSSAQLWRPLALQVLADLTPVYNGPVMGPMHDVIAPDTAAQLAADLAAVEPLDFGGSGGGGVVLPSPSMAAAVVAAASLRGSNSRGSSSRGSSCGGGADRAAAEAVRKEREAAAAERRRMEREAAAAARREEETRRRVEWEEANRRKREEREAKAQRQRQMKEASEVRKVAERMEREARKRAEIEASNARRTAEREMAEARRKAERDAAAERRRSRSLTPERPLVSTASKTVELKLPTSHSSPTSTASTVSPRLPPPPLPSAAAASRLASTPGVIHSPMPVRLVPYSGQGSLASRLAQAGGGGSGNNGGGVSGMGGYGTGAAIGAFGSVDLDPAAAAATINLPERESVASPVDSTIPPVSELPSALAPTGNVSSTGPRFGPALTPALTAPWAIQPPPLPPPPPSTSTASTAGSRISPVHLGSSPSTVQTGTTTADASPPRRSLDPDIGGAVGFSLDPVASIAPKIWSGGGSGGGGGATAIGLAAAATPAVTAAAAGAKDEIDDLTARLVARAQQFADITDTALPSHSSAVPPSLQSGISAPQPLKLAQSEPPVLPGATQVVGGSGAPTGGSGTILKLSSNTTLQPRNMNSSPQQVLPPHELQPQAAVSSPRSSIALTATQQQQQQQQQRLEKQLEQLQQQLQQLQQQQKQQTTPTTRLANVSSTPSAQGQSPSSSSLPLLAAAAGTAVGAAAQPPLSRMSAGSMPRRAAAPPPEPTAATHSEDIVAQARALLESTRNLAPNISAPSTVPAANGKAVVAARSSGGGSGSGSGIPGAVVVGSGHSAGGGGGSPVGGSNDQLISKRSGRTQSPPAMFLPSARRQVGGGVGGTNPNVRRASGDVSPVAGGTAQNPISEIEPAAGSLSNSHFQNQKFDASPSASEFTVNTASVVAAAAAAISGGGVDSRTNATPSERLSVEIMSTSTAAAAAATVLTAGVAEGSVRGSGQPPSAGLAAATAGPSRTGEGMLLHSEEDYGMWLAQRQKMSQPGSEASVMQLQPQPRSQLQPQPSILGVTPASSLQPTAAAAPSLPATPMVPPMAGAAKMAALHTPTVSTSGMAGVAAASPGSSVGSNTTAPGGAVSGGGKQRASGGGKQRASGIESVKKGLSRIGRKIVNGLNP